MGGMLSTLILVLCLWSLWAWARNKRAEKRRLKQEAEERKRREAAVLERQKEREERERLRHERYLAYLEAEKEAEARRQAEWEAGAAERARKAEEREKAEIAQKLKEKQRRRDLEAQVRQEMIDSGGLFGEQTKRPPIPRDVVDAVYRRDGARCVYCGSTENLQLDHIIPFSKGGATTLENLQLLCQKCNLEKSNKIG